MYDYLRSNRNRKTKHKIILYTKQVTTTSTVNNMNFNGSDDNGQQCGGSGDTTSSKKECTSCERRNVDAITEGIDKVAILDTMSTCACCGEEGNDDDMNTCNKCKEVKYCNAVCKKKHRSKHKKKCERRVAELYEEALFKEHPPNEECPICLLFLPIDNNTSHFQTCCGKRICNGCKLAMKMRKGKKLCAFCRTPRATTIEENLKRTMKLIDSGNAEAFSSLGGHFAEGSYGLSQDYRRANELWLKAGELGCAGGYYNLGCSYRLGDGVEVDQKKAKYYFELAAMCGHIKARHNLGCSERQAGNLHRAIKHMIMAAKAGDEVSLNTVKHCFMQGIVKKDEYANTLRAHQQRKDEMKSDARDEAAAPQNQVLFG